MKHALTYIGLAAITSSPALAQQPPAEGDGAAKAEGIAPDKVRGAIETQELVDEDPSPKADAIKAALPEMEVTTGTTTRETPTAVVEVTTEVVKPVQSRPELDAETPIAPEVKAVVDANARYTTEDLAKAQHEALLATPVSVPTKVVMTTTVTPKSDD